MISVGYAGRPFCSRQTLSAHFVQFCAGTRPPLCAAIAAPRHGTIGLLTAAKRLRYEFTPRPARSTNRPRPGFQSDAAPELHDRPRAVLQWAEPRDAALFGAEPIGRALQGRQDARQVDLLPPRRKCCGQTGCGWRPHIFPVTSPHPARRDASRTQPAAQSLAPRSARARQDNHARPHQRGNLPAWAARQGFRLDVLDHDLPAVSDACRWIWARMSRGLSTTTTWPPRSRGCATGLRRRAVHSIIGVTVAGRSGGAAETLAGCFGQAEP